MRSRSIWHLLLAAAWLAGAACASGGGGGAPPPGGPPGAKAPAAGTAPGPPARPAPPLKPAAPRARQAADERYEVPAKEISDYVLQSMIGIVTVSVGVGGDDQEQTPPLYDNDGDRFTMSGRILLRGTRPVSAFRVGTDAIVNRSRAVVRRYPMLARKGAYVKAALEPSGRRTGWLRRTPEGAFPNSVDVVDLDDAGSFRCYQLDLLYLAGAGQRKLFEKPDKAAAFTLVAVKPGAAGALDGDLVPLQRKGNFLEIAAVRGLDDPRTGIGWVELKDAKGRLTVWFTPGPDC
jgi:hypothetical protein